MLASFQAHAGVCEGLAVNYWSYCCQKVCCVAEEYRIQYTTAKLVDFMNYLWEVLKHSAALQRGMIPRLQSSSVSVTEQAQAFCTKERTRSSMSLTLEKHAFVFWLVCCHHIIHIIQ